MTLRKSTTVVLLLVLGAACGGARNPVADDADPEPMEEAIGHRCEAVPEGVVDRLEESLTIDAVLDHPKAVVSEGHTGVSFVSALVEWDDPRRHESVATWVVRGEEREDLPEILSVNAVARAHSDFADGTRHDPAFTMNVDGAEESEACVEAAAAGTLVTVRP